MPTPPSGITLEQAKAWHDGLTSQEARRRLAEFGYNDPAPERPSAAVMQALLSFANPLVAVLLVASVISAILGETLNASIIAVIVALSVALNLTQTFRSQRAVDALRQRVAATAKVRRDGQWTEVLRSEVVPGDLVRLAAGDLVPADAWLIESRDLHVQEAALTGESMPVEKAAARASQPDPANAVYLGTSVVSGTATALVYATGGSTAFGSIAHRLVHRPPQTEFERGIHRFGILIMRTVFFLVLFVLAVNVALRRDPLDSLLFAVALAVGLTPEFLPMITAVTLGQGAIQMARQRVIVKRLEAIQNFGSIDILCSDKTGTLTSGEMSLVETLDFNGNPSDRVLLLAYLNSLYESGIQSPLDAAVLRASRPDVDGYAKVDEIPFDFERRRLSIVVERNGDRLLIVKGAPEGILPLCIACDADGTEEAMSADALHRAEETYKRLSADGYRVLAIASRRLPPQESYRPSDERDLTLAGFATFSDPPLEDVAGSLARLHDDGVAVKILSGDNEMVAQHVCNQVGIDTTEIVLGSQIDRMTDAALGHVAERAAIFARVSPAQKNRIILALKSRGHVVGYLGDGINDAPSLRAADVGISVANGVDVAKDTADIILGERSLAVLHDGIIAGRRAFGNVMKYLLMGTSSNFGNMFSMAGASLFLPFLPMLPTQILLNNLLYDTAQVTIPSDNVDPTFLRRPRQWDMSLIRDFMIVIGPISSLYDFLTFFVLIRVFHASETLFHTGWFVESLATQTLVLFIIRTAGNPLRSRPSRPLALTTLAVVATGIVLPFSPLAAAFGFTALPLPFFIFLAGATLTYLAFVEVAKRRLMRRLLRVDRPMA